MKVPFIDFSIEYEGNEKEYSELLLKHLKEGEFIGGNSVAEFENSLSEYLSVENVISVGNGTDALIIALESLELERKEVIVPAFSFFATSEAIVQAGLVPKFIDVSIDDCNIDVDQIENNITKKTGAILPVHLFGKSSNMNEILSLATKYKLKIVEDTAQSFGTQYNNKFLGTIGDIGCFSFFPTKTLGAYGDGGAITTDNKKLADRARMLKNHGASRKYFNEIIGYNSRLDSIQASFLSMKLKKMTEFISLRKKAGNFYNKLLEKNENLIIVDNHESSFNYYSIVLKNGDRDELQNYLNEAGVSTAIYYPKTLPSLPAHNVTKKFPNAEFLSKNILSIPIFPSIEEDQQIYVADKIKEFYLNN